MHRMWYSVVGGVIGFLLFGLVGILSGATEDPEYWVIIIVGAVGGVLTGSVMGSASENEF